MKRLRIIVSGIVQGVNYRFFTYHAAIDNNIKGFVRNLVDGTVEVDAQGSDIDLKVFVNRLRQGPGSGYVSGLEINELQVDKNIKKFEIKF